MSKDREQSTVASASASGTPNGKPAAIPSNKPLSLSTVWWNASVPLHVPLHLSPRQNVKRYARKANQASLALTKAHNVILQTAFNAIAVHPKDQVRGIAVF